MADEAPAEFECDQCGKRFHWSPQIAGRRVRCPCGAMLTCPDQWPFGAEPIDVIPVTPTPPHAPAPPAAKPQHVTVRRVAQEGQRRASLEPGTIRDIYMPLCLIGGGLVIEMIAIALTAKNGFANALLSEGRDLAIQVVATSVLIFLTSKIRHFSLGPPALAVLKVTAVCIAVPAILRFFQPILNAICFGSIIGLLAALILYFTLLGALFDLEAQDTWDCMGVVFFGYVAMSILQRFVLGK